MMVMASKDSDDAVVNSLHFDPWIFMTAGVYSGACQSLGASGFSES